MGIALSTAGSIVGYGFESTAGTRPTINSTNFTALDDILETPDLNPEPSNLDTTPLSAKKYKTSTEGLIDLGMLAFNSNVTTALYSAWDTICTTAETNEASGKRMWIFVYLKGFGRVQALPVHPVRFSLGSLGVDSVAQTPIRVTPMGDDVFVAVTEDTSGFPTEGQG